MAWELLLKTPLMFSAKEIVDSINANRITHSPLEIRRMVKHNKWLELSKIFNFNPVFHFEGNCFIDWRCIPKELLDVLQSTRKSFPSTPPPVKRKKKPRNRPKSKTRGAILYESQKGVCHYCLEFIPPDEWSIEHKIPLCRGGGNDSLNTVGACKDCNKLKSNLTEPEFMKFGKIVNGKRFFDSFCGKLRRDIITQIGKTLVK